MGARYIDSGESIYIAAVTTAEFTAPSRFYEGDFLVVSLSINATTGSVTPPAGWSELFPMAYTASVGHVVYYHHVTAAEVGTPTYTWTTPSGAQNLHWLRFRGVSQAAPINASLREPDGTASKDVASITTSVANCLIVGGASHQSSASQAINIPASGWTELINSSGDDGGRAQVQALKGIQATAGATGNAVFPATSALSGWVWQFALAPGNEWRLTMEGTGQAVGDTLDEALYVAGPDDVLPGFNAVENTGTGGLLKISSSNPAQGSRSLSVSTTASSSPYVEMDETSWSATTRWYTTYLYIPSGSPIPANWDVIQVREASTLFRLRVTTARNVAVVNGSTAVSTGSVVLAQDTLYRVVFRIVVAASGGSLQAVVYLGNSETVVDTAFAPGLNTGTVLPTNTRSGIPIALAVAGPFILDDLWGNDTGDPGPTGVAVVTDTWSDDFETGSTATNWVAFTGTPTPLQTAMRNGRWGCRFSPANSAQRLGTSTTKWTQTNRYGRLSQWVRFNTLPAPGVSADVVTIQNVFGTNHFDLFINGTGEWQCDLLGSDSIDTGIVVQAGVWYLLEALVDFGGSGGTEYVASLRINGKRFGPVTSVGQTGSFVRSYLLGTAATDKTYEFDADDSRIDVSTGPLSFPPLTLRAVPRRWNGSSWARVRPKRSVSGTVSGVTPRMVV